MYCSSNVGGLGHGSNAKKEDRDLRAGRSIIPSPMIVVRVDGKSGIRAVQKPATSPKAC